MSDRRIAVNLTANTRQFVGAMSEAHAATQTLRGRIQSLSSQARRQMRNVGIGAVAMTGAMVVAYGRAISASGDFERSITRLDTQIGLTRREMNELGNAALNLSHTGRGPRELADAAFYVASAGLRGRDALEALEASSKGAAIGLGDTAVVADLVTSAVNAYGSDVLGATQATDILIGAVREGKAEAPEFAASLGRVLPIASEMGISFEEVGAATAAMTRTGSDAAEATTMLRQIMVSILRPAEQAEAAMGEFGLSSAQLRDVIREDGLWAALTLLRDSVGDNDEAISRIFPNVRALAGFLDLTGANADETSGIFERMNDTLGLTEDAFLGVSMTLAHTREELSANFEAAQIGIGQVLQPIAQQLTQWLADFFDWVKGLDEGTKAVITTITALGTTFLGLAGMGLLFVSVLTPIMAGLTGLKILLTAATTQMGLKAAAVDVLSAKYTALQARLMALSGGTASLRALLVGITAKLAVVTALIAAAGYGIYRYQQRQQALNDAKRSWLQILEDEESVLDKANQGAIRERLLQHENMIDLLNTTGLTIADLIGYLQGEEDALQKVNDALEHGEDGWGSHLEATYETEKAKRELARILGIEAEAIEGVIEHLERESEARDEQKLQRIIEQRAWWQNVLRDEVDDLEKLGMAYEQANSVLEAHENRHLSIQERYAGTADALEALQAQHGDAWASIGTVVESSVTRYQEKLNELNEANQKAAQDTAAALEDSETSWEDFYTEVKSSTDLYVEALDETEEELDRILKAQVTIRNEHGADVAAWWSRMYTQDEDLAWEMYDNNLDQLKEYYKREKEIRNAQAEFILGDLEEWGIDIVDKHGNITQDAVDVVSHELGEHPTVTRKRLEESETVAEARGKEMEKIMERSGEDSVEGLLEGMGKGPTEIDKEVRRWQRAVGALSVNIPVSVIPRVSSPGRVHTVPTTGGYLITAQEQGGILSGGSPAKGRLPSSARIQQPRPDLVQWAEPSTGGEAFIPLARNKWPRSREIWAETGQRLGMFEQGGFRIPNTMLSPLPRGGMSSVARGSDGAAIPINIRMMIDGREFARATGEYTREEMRQMEVSLK